MGSDVRGRSNREHDPRPPPFPLAGPWQLAFAIISEWRRSIAVLVMIMFLGWPAIVIKHWGEETELWPSQYTKRQNEHEVLIGYLKQMTLGMDKHIVLLDEVIATVKTHHNSSIKKDLIIAHLILEDCETEVGRSKGGINRCKRLQKMFDTYDSNQLDHH